MAKAKSAPEEILAGDAATEWGSGNMGRLLRPSPGGLAYLNELSLTHQGYVHRDMRKHRLSIYGSANSKENIRRALVEKAR